MKTAIAFVALVVVFLAQDVGQTQQVEADAPKYSEVLSYFVGTWRGDGESFGLASRLRYASSAAWDVNDRCIVERVASAYGEIPFSVKITTIWDPSSRGFRVWGVNTFGGHWERNWKVVKQGDFFSMKGEQSEFFADGSKGTARARVVILDKDHYCVVVTDARRGEMLGQDWIATFSRRPNDQIDFLSTRMTVLNGLINRNPDDAGLRRCRAFVLGQQHQWQEAAKDLQKIVQRDRPQIWDWYRLAILLRQTDIDKYLKHCVAIRKRFDDRDNFNAYGKALQATLLHADASVDWPSVVAQAKDCVQRTTKAFKGFLSSHRRAMLGMAQYRAKQYQDAVDTLKPIQKEGPNSAPSGTAKCLLALAMAYVAQDKPSAARECFDEAKSIMEEEYPWKDGSAIPGFWHDWLICDLMRREAESLLKARE
jgi:tetratricopeptide (TPR) repeat protein